MYNAKISLHLNAFIPGRGIIFPMKSKLLILVPAVALLGSGCWDIFAVKETRNTP